MNNNNVKLIVINFPLIRPIVDGLEQAHFEGARGGDPWWVSSLGISRDKPNQASNNMSRKN